jgi:hypothetical protein
MGWQGPGAYLLRMNRACRLAPLALLALPLLSGCIARTAASIVTAPVRVASKGVDMMTTSQSEADEKRGRELRRREEKLGRLERDYERHNAQCLRGDEDACDKARLDYGEIQNLRPMVPAEPR